MRFVYWPYQSLVSNCGYAAREYIPGLFKRPIFTICSTLNSRSRSEFWLFASRWIIPCALLGRYFLHSHTLDERLPFLTPPQSFWTLWLALVVYLVTSQFHHHLLYARTTNPRDVRRFGALYVAADMVFIAMFFVLAHSPHSDIPLLYFIPLVLSCQYLPVRNNLWGTGWFVGTFVLSAVLTIAATSGTVPIGEALLVIAPKIIALVVVIAFLLWTLLHLGCLEELFRAVFDNAPDGVTVIESLAPSGSRRRPGAVLRMNQAQTLYAPNARPNRKHCYEEFESPWKQTCAWCPLDPVINEEQASARSITKSHVAVDGQTSDIGYFDVGASLMRDENETPMAAIEIVKEITPQVCLAFMVQAMASETDKKEILRSATKHIRDMFRAKRVDLYQVDQHDLIFRTRVQRGEEDAKFGLFDYPLPAGEGLLKELEKLPTEIETLASMPGPDSRNKEEAIRLSWQSWVVPSDNPDIHCLARMVQLSSGILSLVRSAERGDVPWGLVVIELDPTDGRRNPRSVTRFDVLYSQLATELMSLALRSADKVTARVQSVKAATPPGLHELVQYMAEAADSDKIVSLALLGATANVGLGFTRAVYLRYKDGILIPAMGVGPVRPEETQCWQGITATRFSEYVNNANWESSLLSSAANVDLLRLRSAETINIEQHPNSCIQQVCAAVPTVLLADDRDSFSKTGLMRALRFDGDYAIATVQFGKRVHGVLVVDRAYTDGDRSISDSDMENLQFLASLAGACLQAVNCPSPVQAGLYLQLLVRTHSKSHWDKVEKFGTLCSLVGQRLEFPTQELENLSLAARLAKASAITSRQIGVTGDGDVRGVDSGIISEKDDAWRDVWIRFGGAVIVADIVSRRCGRFETSFDDSSMLERIAQVLRACEALFLLQSPEREGGLFEGRDGETRAALLEMGIHPRVVDAVMAVRGQCVG